VLRCISYRLKKKLRRGAENWGKLETVTAYLRGHHSLPFGDQGTFRAQAFAVTTLPLVTPQPRDEAVIPATGALRSPLFPVRSLAVLVVLRPAPALAAKHGSVPRRTKSESIVSLCLFTRPFTLPGTDLVVESFRKGRSSNYLVYLLAHAFADREELEQGTRPRCDF